MRTCTAGMADSSLVMPDTPAAAFFDLDRTLMSGSSAFYFGKAAYREGLLPMSRLFVDGSAALMFKLFGASDEQSEAIRDRILARLGAARQAHGGPELSELDS